MMARPLQHPKVVWAYLHGFLSGPESFKGRYFQQYLKKYGIVLHLVDLNGPQGHSGEKDAVVVVLGVQWCQYG